MSMLSKKKLKMKYRVVFIAVLILLPFLTLFTNTEIKCENELDFEKLNKKLGETFNVVCCVLIMTIF